MNELKKNHENSIKIFNMKNLLSWSGSSVSPNITPKFNETLQKLIQQFDKYASIDKQYNESKDIKQKRGLRTHFDKMEDDLAKLFGQACRIFDEATAAEAEEEKAKTIKKNELEKLDSDDPEIENDKSRHTTEKMNVILDRNMELETKVADKDSLLASKDFDIKQITTEFEKAKRLLSIKSSKIEAISNLSALPKTVSEAIKLIEALFPENIAFSEEAKKSAREASNVSIDTAWPCLFKSATTLHELFFNASEKESVDIQKEFRNRTGFELAMTEGKQTKRDPNFSKLRTIVYEGKEISIVPHVKSGSKKSNLLRVHFCPDNDNRKIIVGHCGGHLNNYTTKSQK